MVLRSKTALSGEVFKESFIDIFHTNLEQVAFSLKVTKTIDKEAYSFQMQVPRPIPGSNANTVRKDLVTTPCFAKQGCKCERSKTKFTTISFLPSQIGMCKARAHKKKCKDLISRSISVSKHNSFFTPNFKHKSKETPILLNRKIGDYFSSGDKIGYLFSERGVMPPSFQLCAPKSVFPAKRELARERESTLRNKSSGFLALWSKAIANPFATANFRLFNLQSCSHVQRVFSSRRLVAKHAFELLPVLYKASSCYYPLRGLTQVMPLLCFANRRFAKQLGTRKKQRLARGFAQVRIGKRFCSYPCMVFSKTRGKTSLCKSSVQIFCANLLCKSSVQIFDLQSKAKQSKAQKICKAKQSKAKLNANQRFAQGLVLQSKTISTASKAITRGLTLATKQNEKRESVVLQSTGKTEHAWQHIRPKSLLLHLPCKQKGSKKSFPLVGKKMRTPVILDASGRILTISKTQLILQKTQPVLFYNSANLHVKKGEWVKEGAPILTLTHQTLITGDIVQGIPRIEQLFEAFTSPPSAFKDRERSVTKFKDVHDTLHSQVRDIFRKHWFKSVLPIAVRKSLEEIQYILVESIQKVYLSQGVLIADKHIEIIIRQIASKGQILDSGSTGLFLEEVLPIRQIENANLATPGKKCLYVPAVVGLTAAALSSDSFISAASFQETTRVLSRDAVVGKTDFLRGLKEKVVIGDLISAGTGLDIYFIYTTMMVR